MAMGILRKRNLLLLLPVLILLVGGYFTYQHIAANRNKTNPASIQTVLDQVKPLIDTNKYSEQETIINKLKQVKNYDKNVDALYAVTRYYIGIGDSVNARANFDKLSKLFIKNKSRQSPYFKVTSATIKTLNASVTELEAQYKQLLKNANFPKEL